MTTFTLVMKAAPLKQEAINAVLEALTPLLDEGNQGVLRDWAYLCQRKQEAIEMLNGAA